MSEQTPFTRRQFLLSNLAMLSTIGTVPAFLSQSASVLAGETSMRLSSKPGVPDDRILVVVQLSGGNDGLNTVVPFGMNQYYQGRPGIAVPEGDVLPLDERTGVGLHPALREIRELIGEGLASIVQGVGYPNPNRSHFASMDVWHTGDTRGGRGHGWIGRALDRATTDKAGKPTQPEPLQCICIGGEAPLATQGKHVKPVAFERADLFRWVGRDLHPALSQAYDSLHEGTLPPDAGDTTAFIFRTACDAQVASAKVRQAVSRQPETRFPGSNLGRQLQMVAAMIRAELPTRVYYTAMGGFDTHANQPGQHERLLREFSEAVGAFFVELTKLGQRQRVIALAFSEFGRRVRQNASQGTDHGTAGPVFLFGDSVRAGLVGEHPSLHQLDEGDLVHHTDFRTIYAAVLDQWLKLDSRTSLGATFPAADVLRVRA